MELRNFFIKAADKALIFVDEAYIDYLENPMASSMVDLVAKGKNVIVARTFSYVPSYTSFTLFPIEINGKEFWP